jgi:hypothetical protein
VELVQVKFYWIVQCFHYHRGEYQKNRASDSGMVTDSSKIGMFQEGRICEKIGTKTIDTIARFQIECLITALCFFRKQKATKAVHK